MKLGKKKHWGWGDELLEKLVLGKLYVTQELGTSHAVGSRELQVSGTGGVNTHEAGIKPSLSAISFLCPLNILPAGKEKTFKGFRSNLQKMQYKVNWS